VLVGGLATEDVLLGTGVDLSVVDGRGEDTGLEGLGIGGREVLGFGGCDGFGGSDGLGGDVPPSVGVSTKLPSQ
jgi:hypothetical protein